jgi:transposase
MSSRLLLGTGHCRSEGREVFLSIPAWYASMVANVMVPMREGRVEVAFVCQRLDPFLAAHSPCIAPMEACATTHEWAAQSRARPSSGRAMIFWTSDLLVRPRAQLINALRGRLAELGIIAAQGSANVKPLADAIDGIKSLPCDWWVLPTLARLLILDVQSLLPCDPHVQARTIALRLGDGLGP